MAWPRRRHGTLQPLADNLWLVEAPVPGLLAYRRQMVVVRDAQRRLLLHSVIALDDPGMAQLEALGTPTWLVVPNGYHRLDAPAYKDRYPSISVVAPRGAVARVQRAVRVDMTYEEFPAGACLQLVAAPWKDAAEGVVSVQSADGVSLLFNDLLWTPAAPAGPAACSGCCDRSRRCRGLLAERSRGVWRGGSSYGGGSCNSPIRRGSRV